MKTVRLKRKKADTSALIVPSYRPIARYLRRPTGADDGDETPAGRLSEAREPVPAYSRIVYREAGLSLR